MWLFWQIIGDMKLAMLLCALLGQVFDVASIRPSDPNRPGVPYRIGPNSFSTYGPLKDLIQQAYDVEDYQVAGGAAWVQTERYDVQAKAATAATPYEIRRMVQALLAARFQLKIHRETRAMTGFAMTVDKNGAKLPPPKAGLPPDAMGVIQMRGGEMWGRGASMRNLARGLRFELGVPVLDETKIGGNYDFKLRFEEGNDDLAEKPDGPPVGRTPAAGSIFTALKEVGLRLESGKLPVEVLVIDRAERPSEN
jgi:uncharacterized protein (TIGR03435 family)